MSQRSLYGVRELAPALLSQHARGIVPVTLRTRSQVALGNAIARKASLCHRTGSTASCTSAFPSTAWERVSATLPRLYSQVLFLTLALFGLAAVAASAQVTPLPNAHAHNDYEHERPLLDALDHGFCSVEADVHLVDGALLVAHDAEDVSPERTLQSLYLDPLRERVEKNGGRVYPDGPRFILLIDFKTSGEETYAALRPVLEEYAPILTRFTPDSTEERAVTVIISGSRPIETISNEQARYVALDGRVSDLDAPVNPNVMPMISDSWLGRYRWAGRGEMPEEVRSDLERVIAKSHEYGCIVRFWALPHNEDLWRTLRTLGLDLINADDLPRLQAFLLDR